MSELQDYLREQMKDPEFAAEYERLRVEYEAKSSSSPTAPRVKACSGIPE